MNRVFLGMLPEIIICAIVVDGGLWVRIGGGGGAKEEQEKAVGRKGVETAELWRSGEELTGTSGGEGSNV